MLYKARPHIHTQHWVWGGRDRRTLVAHCPACLAESTFSERLSLRSISVCMHVCVYVCLYVCSDFWSPHAYMYPHLHEYIDTHHTHAKQSSYLQHCRKAGAQGRSRWWGRQDQATRWAQAPALQLRGLHSWHVSTAVEAFLLLILYNVCFFQRCECLFIRGQLFRATPVSAVSQNNKLKICQKSLFWGSTFWPSTVIFLGGISWAPAVSAALVKGRWHWVLMSKKYQVT